MKSGRGDLVAPDPTQIAPLRSQRQAGGEIAALRSQ